MCAAHEDREHQNLRLSKGVCLQKVRAEVRSALPRLELDFNTAAHPLGGEDARKEPKEEPKELPLAHGELRFGLEGAEAPTPAFHCCTSLSLRNHTHVQASCLMPDVCMEQSRLFVHRSQHVLEQLTVA